MFISLAKENQECLIWDWRMYVAWVQTGIEVIACCNKRVRCLGGCRRPEEAGKTTLAELDFVKLLKRKARHSLHENSTCITCLQI